VKQIKLRNALIVVLVVALLAYVWELSRRRSEYARRARANEMSLWFYDDVLGPDPGPDEIRHEQYQITMRAYHGMLIDKYKYARDHPWIMVKPDPSRPERPIVDLVRGTQ
jgi:hypothetical protein